MACAGSPGCGSGAKLRAAPREPHAEQDQALFGFYPDEVLPRNSSAWLMRADLQVRAGVGGFVSSWSESRRSYLIIENWGGCTSTDKSTAYSRAYLVLLFEKDTGASSTNSSFSHLLGLSQASRAKSEPSVVLASSPAMGACRGTAVSRLQPRTSRSLRGKSWFPNPRLCRDRISWAAGDLWAMGDGGEKIPPHSPRAHVGTLCQGGKEGNEIC